MLMALCSWSCATLKRSCMAFAYTSISQGDGYSFQKRTVTGLNVDHTDLYIREL
jgi:hypothetical protein